MKIGVTIHATDTAMSPIELAQEAEARGFYSLYLPEHTHIPTSRRTPPPTGDEELAEEYLRSLDPYIALAAAAAVTSKIRLGTGVGLPAQHDTITFAKQLATLDLLSGGRLVLGHRLRLEPRGDGEPRHRREAPPRPGAREDARHAGAVGRTRWRSSTASSCASRRAGSGRSRCSSRGPGS